MEFPALHLINQNFESSSEINASTALAAELERTNLLEPVEAGHKVVITAGSRGIDAMAKVLRGLTEAIKIRGANPVILPAMGSHGGGTAAGQVAVLEHLGLNSATLGAPIHDRLEPVEISN